MESPPAKKDFILFNLTAPSENVSAAQRHLYDVHRLHYLLAENDAYVQDSPRAASSTPVDIDPGDHLAGSYREPDWSPTSTAVDTSGDLSAEMWHLKLDESDSDEGPSLKQTGYSGHVQVEQPSAGTSIMWPGALDSGQYQFGYLAQLTIIQPSIRRPANKEAVYTDLLIDTGSTTSWVSGVHYIRVTSRGHLEAWPAGEALRPGVMMHDFNGLYPDTMAGKPICIIKYEDNACAAVGFSKVTYETQYTIHVPSYTSFPGLDGTWASEMNESIIAGNFLAVAFALKRGTLMKGMDGTLALGSQNIQSSHFQIDGKTVLSGPTTFIEAVQEIVKSGPDKLTNGISIYLCFIYHQPGKSVPAIENSSFIAFNSWPGIEGIQLSSKICTIETALLWGKWVIRLKYLILQEWLPSGWKDQKIIAHVGSSGQEEPIDVILDTGSSMSYLSPDMIEQMASLFNRRPTILNDEAPYFTIPDDFDLQNYRVKYIFEGMSKQHVTVTGNIRPFVYVNHNGVREGLLGPTKRMSVGVLGIKWFQTMIVGLFNSPQGNYVRLAQLTPDNHTLPTFE